MSVGRWSAGDTIAERYVLEARLGSGGSGTTWKARHVALKAPFAVKLLEDEDEESISQLLREARAAAALTTAHVVRVFDIGVDATGRGTGTPYIVMELLSGESLRDRLKREERLSPTALRPIVSALGKAIDKAHRAGIVHGELRPASVFLARDPDPEGDDVEAATRSREIVKVLDFGVARLRGKIRGDGVSTPIGVIDTAYCMSPEQARGSTPVDHRSDLWALGVIAYECLLGVRPVVARPVADLALALGTEPMPVPSSRGAVPSGFDAWFAQATAMAPERRFQSVTELVSTLKALLA